jgi:Protein of unknown function (DUF3592)
MKRTSMTVGPLADLSRFESVPRDVRLTANGWVVMGFAIVLTAGAVAAATVLSAVRAAQQAERATVTADAAPASATVTAVTKAREENPRQVITYRYTVGGNDYESTIRLREEDRRPVAVGSRLPILYRRSEPARSWLPGNEPGVLPLWVVPLIPIALLCLAGLLTQLVRREAALLSEGRFAQARVLATTKVQRQHHHAYRVRFEFTTLSGAIVTGTAERGRAPASVGETVPIVYHRENPKWNALYPLRLVTPDRA